ncbi:MAG: DUF5689 domain-containing protein [Bacteroidales bacterium]|jgi:hypothetical protein|nr:DUF5689 domain-containing protein [Bacteroidales bacterium]
MKNRYIFSIIIIFTGLSIWLTSCFKDIINPDIDIDRAIPVGEIYTLKKLKDSLSLPYTFDHDASVYATVTMDERNGNLYKQIYVQDSLDAIRLIFTESTRFLVGDSLRIYLKGSTVVNNNGTYEIRTLQPDSSVIILANRKYIEPIDATISEINARNYDLKLVRLLDVEFSDSDLGTTWADTTLTNSAVNHTLQDCFGNSILVRTSSYASFAGEKVPSGKGSITAIVGVYGATMQLWTRTMSEMHMDAIRCDGSGGDAEIIFAAPFASGIETFTIEDVAGNQTWEWEQRSSNAYMKMTGYDGVNNANEDWLISPTIDLSGYKEVSLSFNHAGRYSTPFSNYFTVWCSIDDNGFDFSSATWRQLTIPNYMSGEDWAFVASGRIAIPDEYLDKNIRFAFKYTSSNATAGTWEIKDVVLKGTR